MTEYTTDDQFEAIDTKFDAAHKLVLRCICENGPITEEVDDAADTMFDIAIQLGDPLMLAFCLARFSDFIKEKRTPPWSMLEHLSDALTRYRASGGGSLDEAFALKQTGKHRPARWSERLQARTQSRFIEYFTQFMPDARAIAKGEEFFKKPDLRRTYQKYRRIVKSK